MRTEFLFVSVLRVASGPRVKLVSCKSALNPPVVCSTDRSKAVVPVLVLLFVALWFILRGDLLYVFPCVILFLCFSVLLVLRVPRLGKRELILVLFVRLFGLCLFGFVGFLFLLGSGKGCGLFSYLFYGLPSNFTLLETPPTKVEWKGLLNHRIHEAVETHWKSKITIALPKKFGSKGFITVIKSRIPLICISRLLCRDSLIANCLCIISYSIEFSFLIIFTNKFKRFICRTLSTGRMSRSAKQAEFDVLSGKPCICFRHCL